MGIKWRILYHFFFLRVRMSEVGVLALQGNFARHQARLRELGANSIRIRIKEQLSDVERIIIPGGESTAMLKLIDEDFWVCLQNIISSGIPTLATCAGVILLAANVCSPSQKSLGLIDIDVCRNAYGRQIDSFIDKGLNWTVAGKEAIQSYLQPSEHYFADRTLEGVFIRAPKILRVGNCVKTLIEQNTCPVLVQQQNIFAATFHPELSKKAESIHRLFLAYKPNEQQEMKF